jgi:tetratricopeptide (TPR) repeat protein
MKKKDSKAAPFLLLFISLSVLAAAVYGMAFRSKDLENIAERLFSGGTSRSEPLVATYLSTAVKSVLLRDAFELLESETQQLAEVQDMLRRLDTKRNLYIERMAEKEERYEAGISSFALEEILGDLRASGYLERYRSRFAGDLGRRMETFFKMYETRRTALLLRKARHSEKIDELSGYIAQLTGETIPVTLFDGGEVLQSARMQYTARAAFLIERGEFGRARDLLQEAGFSEQDSILFLVLGTASELQQRNARLEEKDPLAEIKMSYLSEEYRDVISLTNRAKNDPFIEPLLSGLTDAARTNIELEHEIMQELELREDITLLFDRAGRMEDRGEYTKACELYRKLLLLDLPPFDIEHIITRMTSCITGSAIADEKRKDNTKAIHLLEKARGIAWNGKKNEAIELYKTIILRFPNSDYIGQALEELEKLLG